MFNIYQYIEAEGSFRVEFIGVREKIVKIFLVTSSS